MSYGWSRLVLVGDIGARILKIKELFLTPDENSPIIISQCRWREWPRGGAVVGSAKNKGPTLFRAEPSQIPQWSHCMRTGGLYAFTGLPYRFPKPLYATVFQEARLLGETPVLALSSS